jgi:hypothetical protein
VYIYSSFGLIIHTDKTYQQPIQIVNTDFVCSHAVNLVSLAAVTPMQCVIIMQLRATATGVLPVLSSLPCIDYAWIIHH